MLEKMSGLVAWNHCIMSAVFIASQHTIASKSTRREYLQKTNTNPPLVLSDGVMVSKQIVPMMLGITRPIMTQQVCWNLLVR
jgi:hypothetical protein